MQQADQVRVATRRYATADTVLKGLSGFEVFKRIEPPSLAGRENAAKWMPLLEACLPPNLRRSDHEQPTVTYVDAPWERAEIILAAQSRPVSKRGVNLLSDLAISQGRWKAAVWLMRDLIDHGAPAVQPTDEQNVEQAPWNGQDSLKDLTEEPITLSHPGPSPAGVPPRISLPAMSPLELEEMQTQSEDSHNPNSLKRLALGVVWRALGAMIVSCGDGPVRPEILEIIAHLHHQDLLPKDIYSHVPRDDVTAIQQPPTLHLLSSRILTSLSDAAWRAHEQVIVDKASATGGSYIPLRPEIPGTAYRIHIAGLRPEVWLELVLWACLHGHWVLEGAAILRSVCKQANPAWKPISWRSLVPVSSGSSEDWHKLDYIFNTRSPKTMDQEAIVYDVKSTVSSEVVNAYIDALLSRLNAGDADSAVRPTHVLQDLMLLHEFLDRSDLKPGRGSRDAVVLRFVEAVGPTVNPSHVTGLMGLSPRRGGEVRPSSLQDTPPYIMHGSAALVGIAHQALRTRIKAGDLHQALQMFNILRKYTHAKRKSVSEKSFAVSQPRTRLKPRELFTSNVDVIDSSPPEPPLPSTVLGPYLDLITDSQAYVLGKKLIYSSEGDGPMISESSYNDPILAPALLRFAVATNDKLLLAKLVQTHAHEDLETGERRELPHNVLQALLDAQIQRHQWSAARRSVRMLAETPNTGWNIVNLAVLARTMIPLGSPKQPDGEESEGDLTEAKNLFAAMVKGEASDRKATDGNIQDQILTLLTVISATDAQWSSFCRSIRTFPRHLTFNLPTRALNQILEGVLDAYGVAAAHGLLTLFWPRTLRVAQSLMRAEHADDPNVPRRRIRPLERVDRHRSVILLSDQPSGALAVYDGPQPDLITIRMMLRRALESLEDDAMFEAILSSDSDGGDDAASAEMFTEVNVPPDSPLGVAKWSVGRLKYLGVTEMQIRKEVEEAMPDLESEYVHGTIIRLLGLAHDHGTGVATRARGRR
ncbi:hypothetical protein LTR12_000932 [Friedmanniomyces endolithicus]|nr:hypothetical protein LTR74_016137 [Friedmanniomyces endolithicus]KAK1824607.1 hypothetical protein LTR12_000932 [Friedmanniomyces endolithicus]